MRLKLPGRAWLQFEVENDREGSRIRQTAIFDPIGLFGLLYWYLLYPLHVLIFKRMLGRIVSVVEGGTAPGGTPPGGAPPEGSPPDGSQGRSGRND